MNQIVLLTGFLGAGKTTFLNHILEEYADTRVGLIVNEFSQTGVDGALIRQDVPGVSMKELNNGSIFCACIKDSFVDSLIDMGRRGLDYVFVEASGLADPSSIVSILDQIRTLSHVEYTYQGAICLIDALNFTKHVKVLVSLRRQVAYSRAVILNKTDMVDAAGLQDARDTILSIHPGVPIYPTTYANVSLREILAHDAAQTPQPEESSNTPDSRPTTYTLSTREAIPPADLYRFLDRVSPFTYRLKGFCRTTDGTKFVSMVGTSREIEAWPVTVDETQLVLISSVGIRIISEALAAAKECFRGPVDLK